MQRTNTSVRGGEKTNGTNIQIRSDVRHAMCFYEMKSIKKRWRLEPFRTLAWIQRCMEPMKVKQNSDRFESNYIRAGYRVHRLRRFSGEISRLLLQLISHQGGDHQDHRPGERM